MGWADDYEPVEDRLSKFWADHPFGRIETNLVTNSDGNYVVKASIYRETETNVAATGYAHDSVDQLPANMKASALEVCETSAIGRALANLGYAPKGKRPSREEMSKNAPRQPSQAAEPAGERSSSAAARVPPPAKSERGAEDDDGSVPSPGPAFSSSEQKPDGEKTDGLDGSGTGQVGVTPVEASAPTCPHLHLDPLKANGRPYPKGYARCLDCHDQGIKVQT